MLRNLFDFSMQRNWKQAAGFYFAWLLAGVLLTALVLYVYLKVSGIIVMPKDDSAGENFAAGLATIQHMGMQYVSFIVFLLATTLALLVVRAKKAFGNPVALACILLAMGLSLPSALLAFIPIAYLTTLPKGK